MELLSRAKNPPRDAQNGAEMGFSGSASVEASGETCRPPRSYLVIESAEHVTMCSFY